MVKVSVVMATYNSGERLHAAVDSVLGQSLPPQEYELVVVDDGSTDGTPDRVRELTAGHPHVVVEQIPNSGWPGRPRNVGTRLARGEYVLYMDHDDDLLPEALERAHRFASEHRADVLLAKEVVVGGATPGWRTYRANVGQVDRVDQRVLQSMTPHKFYRRQFVLDAGVRFPEGPARLEDYNFNAQAYVRAERIAVLADYPCYRWHHHDTNAHTAGAHRGTYWSSFDASLAAPLQELPPGDDQDEYLLRWYRSRVLGRLGSTFLKYSPPGRERWWRGCRRALRHFPPRLDAKLSPRARLRSHLLRLGDRDRLLALAQVDRVAVVPQTEQVRWADGRLHVTVGCGLARPDGSALTFVRRGDRLLRVLPAELVDGVPQEVLEVQDALGHAEVDLGARARHSRVEWPLPSSGGVQVVDRQDGLCEVHVHVEAVLDPATAALGAPLEDDVWTVELHADVLGYRLRAPVPAARAVPLPALLSGRQAVAHRTGSGGLALDLGPTARDLLDDARPTRRDLRGPGPGGTRLVLALPRVHAHGSTRTTAALALDGRPVPAWLVGEGGEATLVADLPPGVRPGADLRAGRGRRAVLALPGAGPLGRLRGLVRRLRTGLRPAAD